MRLFLPIVMALFYLSMSRPSSAFRGGSSFQVRGSLMTERRSFLLFRHSRTSLFERQDNDGGDDDKRPINNLDIFGQPKTENGKKKNLDDEGEIRGPDRIKSCIPYVLPLIDGDTFGKYIYERIPPLGTLDYVLLRPLVECIQTVPFLGIMIFTAFAIGPRLTNQSREVRFNAQQAVFIDVAIIFPTLIGEAVNSANANLPRSIIEPCSNFVWYAYVSMVIYCIASNLRGKKPDQIPFISNFAEIAIGPF
ncbi:hypothetical protein ACHAXA_007545 [Cyclostephanos tholiformis]|uniref:Protein TIC 20 n=1 Tax=Cyclostephanos tholiformis TaxID=382380 RepID=A0ABD3SS60_9STRA